MLAPRPHLHAPPLAAVTPLALPSAAAETIPKIRGLGGRIAI